MWQIDCDNFRKVDRPFELRNATTLAHEMFVVAFCKRYDWEFKRTGPTVLFSPKPARRPRPAVALGR